MKALGTGYLFFSNRDIGKLVIYEDILRLE